MIFSVILIHLPAFYDEMHVWRDSSAFPMLESVREPNLFFLALYSLSLTKRRKSWQSFLDKRPGLDWENYGAFRWYSLFNRSLNNLIAAGGARRFLLIKSTVTDLNTGSARPNPETQPLGREHGTGWLEFAVTRASVNDLSERTLPRSHGAGRRREGKSSIKAQGLSSVTFRNRRGGEEVGRQGASLANQGKRLGDY